MLMVYRLYEKTILEGEKMKMYKQIREKISAFVLAFVMMISMISFPVEVKAATIPGGTVLYLKPNSNWTQASARFAAYFYGDGETWVNMTDSDGDGIYEVTSPADKAYTNVIFCRMNPSATANNWDNKWNQTSDLTYDGTNNMYTVNAGTWDMGGGTWSSHQPDTPENGDGSDTPEGGEDTPGIPEGTLLYLKTNSNWNEANARFAAYFFGNGDAWVSMTDSDGDGIYEVTSPTDKAYTNVIFCRMTPHTNSNDWGNKWNQTADLTYNGIDNMYTITEGTWDVGTWSHKCFENQEKSNGYCDNKECNKIIDDIAALAGLSLTLDGKIGVNFYVELTENLLDATNAKMVFKYANITQEVEVNTLEPKTTDDGKAYYIFTCKVAAKEMADVITAQVVADGIEGKKFTTSVRNYANCIVNDKTNNEDYAKAASLVDAMLRYGAYSQTYFKYNTDDMADSILAKKTNYLDSVSIENFVAYTPDTIEITGENASKYNASSLILESEVKLRHYFSEEISGATKKGNEWYIESELIPANNLNKTIETIKDTVVIKYSPFNYVYKALNSENTSVELKNLMKAMYLYNVEAITYDVSSAQ